ncbi:ankyrin [Astrocystis sublimbata]|nr:ankyrin [Astrocystis sublimbata]KAI0187385.1 ankyrin [Astrocystis sublimbata]KAI0203419.1 ankyrin [Astrocystis sublimbata]KAI0203422.1 ankyrin [Astrocystis sublimbata]
MSLHPENPKANALKVAICAGDTEALRAMLEATPDLAQIRIGHFQTGIRTPLHILTDYPGHLPHRVQTARLLIEYGADINVAFEGPQHSETPLHWAASCNDVDLIGTLLDAGADIEAPGGVIGGGSPLADARAFLQIEAAHELIRRGASVGLQDASTLGLLDRVRAFYESDPSYHERSVSRNVAAEKNRSRSKSDRPSQEETDGAFWNACHGGQLGTAKFLFEHGANINAVPSWEPITPLEAAQRSEAQGVVDWLNNTECTSQKP